MAGTPRISWCLLYLALFATFNGAFVKGEADSEYDYSDDEYVDIDNVDGEADSYQDGNDKFKDTKIVTKPEEFVVNLGSTIRLPCQVSGKQDDLQLIWDKKTERNASNDVIAIGTTVVNNQYRRASLDLREGSTLVIGLAEPEDAGEYTCYMAVTSDQRPEVTHRVSIRVPPAIKSSSESFIEASQGMDVRLFCRGTGSPTPTIKWTKIGKGRLPGGKSELSADELFLGNVGRKQAGVYRCTASNGFGNGASKDIEVKVLYSPEIVVEEMFIHSREGDKVDIICNIHAFPRPTVTWKKDGQPIQVQDNNKLVVSNINSRHSLEIKSVEKSDFGSYSCHARNDKGSAHQTVEISGRAAPAEYKSRPRGREETTYVLEWTVQSYTPVTKFKLETRPENGAWQPVEIEPSQDGPYHYAGKHYLKELEPATRYEARVSANNDEGWNNPRIFYFATRGAEPRLEGVTGNGNGLNSSSTIVSLVLAVILYFNIHN